MILLIIGILDALMMYLLILGGSRNCDRAQEDREQIAFLEEYRKTRGRKP